MQDKYTALVSPAPDELRVVPPESFVVTCRTADLHLEELRPGRPVPPGSPALMVYAVPAVPVETRFAVLGAIDCLKPNGTAFQPGFCFDLSLRYMSAIGLRKLLTACRQKNGRLPDCVTLEDLQSLLSEDIRRIAQEAARSFSGGQTLSYTHWWQEFQQGGRFCESLRLPLMQLFTAYGFRLDMASVSLAGLAPVPV